MEQEILTNSARTDPESSFKSYDDSVNRFDYVFSTHSATNLFIRAVIQLKSALCRLCLASDSIWLKIGPVLGFEWRIRIKLAVLCL